MQRRFGNEKESVDKHVLEYIPLYLDDELQEAERLTVERHIRGCADCRAALEAERDLISAIRRARPGDRAPAALHQNTVALLEKTVRERRLLPLSWPIAASVLLVVAVTVVWLATAGRPRGAENSFVTTAVNTHLHHVRGQLPLEVVSDSPATISAWFAGKLRFNLKLPDYPEVAGKPKPYQIEGARLVSFKDDYAAYIVYHLNSRPISLLVTSDSAAQPSGGEEIPWQGLRFHFQSVAGWKVLTWSDNGLTYALVSDLEERGQASCIVCHQNERVFKGLQSADKRL
jgi:anti-sigma factor RsiW